ncbi:MAG: general secretion pathway protein GspB [Candidatus Omnitrophota bacterium]|nr:general secretion pathway protein GspB [Candidatus Omnitrophota bacterium]
MADDAVKKTQPPKLIYLIYLLMVVAGFFLTKFTFSFFINRQRPQTQEIATSKPLDISPAQTQVNPAQETKTATAPELPLVETPPAPQEVEKTAPQLLLNGIFFDETQPYALINNQIVKRGDMIEGAKVVQILSNEVVLEFEGTTIKLKTYR